MNTENRSLSGLSRQGQAGLPRRGMRTGRDRAPEPDEETPLRPASREAEAPLRREPEVSYRDEPEDEPPDSWTAEEPEAARPAGARRAYVEDLSALFDEDDEPDDDDWPDPRETAPAELLPSPLSAIAPPAPQVWNALRRVPLDVVHLERQRIISATRADPSSAAFDVLRTRLLQALIDNGWRRVAITSATKNCGKSFVASNLALSLSRAEATRSLLMDMDLRNPSLAKMLGVKAPGPVGDLLRGLERPEDHLVRFGDNRLGVGTALAMGLNDRVERDAAELLQSREAAIALAGVMEAVQPDVVLFDLPPALYHDDVLAFRDQYDGVLLIVGGGVTKAEEITEVSRRLADHTPLLGVVLNRAEGPTIRDYSY